MEDNSDLSSVLLLREAMRNEDLNANLDGMARAIIGESKSESHTGNKDVNIHRESTPECSDVPYKVLELHPKSTEDDMKFVLTRLYQNHFVGTAIDHATSTKSHSGIHRLMGHIVYAALVGERVDRELIDTIVGNKTLATKIIKRMCQANALIPKKDHWTVGTHIIYTCTQSFDSWISNNVIYKRIADLMEMSYRNDTNHFNLIGVRSQFGEDGVCALKIMEAHGLITKDRFTKSDYLIREDYRKAYDQR